MGEHGKGLSRRQFLLLGGGTAAAVYAGLGFRRTTSAIPTGAQEAALSAPLRSFRRPPFTDTFANSALPDWNVRRPVAIFGTTPYGALRAANASLDRTEFLRGRGTVLGLDGSLAGSAGPGLIETVDAFGFEPGPTYRLSFSIAGSHQSSDRLPPSTLTARLPGLDASRRVTLRPYDDFETYSFGFTVRRPTVSTVVFASENAPGQAGLLLESVALIEES